MSGTISLSPAVRWSAASWLFAWVLQALASAVEDTELAAELGGVVQENIGWFGLDDLKREQAVEIRDIIRNTLRSFAENSLPTEMAGRDDAFRHVDELIWLTSETCD